jgi:hypothetical protein
MQEMPVPQCFLEFAFFSLDARMMRVRVVAELEEARARTLSRLFWQSKNFHR